MKYSLDILEHYIEKGLVEKQVHPSLPLSIYNYTRECQYERKWDSITLNCRGLILDNEGNVIAKAFPKFFNIEEHSPEEIPNESFEVFEKMDGSLGIAFYYKGDWIMATRGSFTSEQAIKGTEMLKKLSVVSTYPLTALRESWTYLFEIIYKKNRIVCDYDFEGLVLLGAYDRETLKEVDFEILTNSVALFDDVRVVRKYNGIFDFTKLKETISNDAEGYVIRFRSGMRMKIKGDEYVRLHRILTEFSTVDIWEILKAGNSINGYLEKVPDEFDGWVRETVTNLQSQFDLIKNELEAEFKQLVNKKEFAEKIKDNPNRALLFKRLDSYSSQLDSMIWERVKPKYEKPFWKKK